MEQEEIKKIIGDLFRDVPYHLGVCMDARKGHLCLLLSYEDFLSEATLKGLLNPILSKKTKVVITRKFSDAAVAAFLLRRYKENDVAVVDCCNGSLVAEPISRFVYNRLKRSDLIGKS